MEPFQVWDITCFSGRCFIWMMRLLVAKGHKSEWQHVTTCSFTSLSIRQGNSLPDMAHSRCAPDQTLQGSITDGMHSLCFGHPKRPSVNSSGCLAIQSRNVEPKTPFICPQILRETCKASASCQKMSKFSTSNCFRNHNKQGQACHKIHGWQNLMRGAVVCGSIFQNSLKIYGYNINIYNIYIYI